MSDVEIRYVVGDVMAYAPENFDGFDAMLVDPPYSDHVHENMASHGSNGRGSRPRDPGFDSLSPEARLALLRIAARMKRWSAVFSDMQTAHVWNAAASRQLEPIRWVPWIRWSQPQLSGDRPPSGCELVLLYHPPGAKIFNGPGNLTHHANLCLRGADKHPTEKPLDLMLDLVSWYSNPGESVLDPMAGAGTTAVACKLLGRNCLAIERDEHWQALAERRIALGGPKRDADRAREWCETTEAEASAHLAKPAAKNGEDQNTRRRAQARLDDVARVRAWL